MTKLLATVTEYKGILVLELKATASSAEVATSLDRPGNIGQVIMNTRKNLGVSAEAIDLLKTVRVGHDSIGDVDWFQSSADDTFGWLGGPFSIKNPANCEAARNFKVLSHVVIANEPAQGAMEAIDNMLRVADMG